MTETILLYNCEGEKWSRMRTLLAMVKLRMRMIQQEQYAIPLEQLWQGKGDPAQTPYEGEGFDEPMLVFCNVHPGRIPPILEVLRRAELPATPIKGILTQSNQSWGSDYLYRELFRERAAVAEGKQAQHEQDQQPTAPAEGEDQQEG